MKLIKKSDKPNISSYVLAAKNIRKELKVEFPKTKFKVRSSSFSMGNSIDVDWTNGPTNDSVDEIIKKYQYGNFNCMEDIYEYNKDFNDQYGESKYIHGNRRIDENIKKDVQQMISADRSDVDEWVIQDLASRVLNKTDLQSYDEVSSKLGIDLDDGQYVLTIK
jgi:hypothetical protein